MNILLLSALALVSADDYLELPIYRAFTRETIPAKEGYTGIKVNGESLHADITVRGVHYSTHLEPESGDIWIFEDSEVSDRRTPTEYSYKFYEYQNKNSIFSGPKYKNGLYYVNNVTYDKANFKMPYAIINKELNFGDPKVGGLGLGPRGAPTLNLHWDILAQSEWRLNFVDNVRFSGLAQSDAFTINLDADPSKGDKLVIGAMDLSRFTGKLQHIYKSRETKLINAEFAISDIETNAALDIENANTYLADEVVAAIAKKFGAEWDENHNLYSIDNMPQDDLVLNFEKLELRVPPADVWVQDREVSNKWFFTIRPRSSYTLMPKKATLGADILKSTYIVWDLGRNFVAFGQAERNPGPANYKVIPASGIPTEYLNDLPRLVSI